MASRPYDWDYNIKKSISMIKEASNNKVDICLLPEVFIPGYSLTPKNFEYAESLDGKTIESISEIAKELNIYISGSIIEKKETDFYNTMFIIGPEGLLGTYHKKYVYSMEQKFWKRGKNISVIDSKFGSIGLGICADMHYAELWEQYAGNVDLILICSAWPDFRKINIKFANHEFNLCKSLPIKISDTLQVPVAYCNAAHECQGKFPITGALKCCGFSKIVQNGNVISSLDSGDEGILYGEMEIDGNRPKIDHSHFKNWIKYSFTEKIPKYFVENTISFFARRSYNWNKKKFLK